MVRNTKKLLIIISIIISLFTLSGCNKREYEYHPSINAKKEAKRYFEYLKNKDIKSLNKLFSLNVQNSHNLEKEWNAFFDAIDGNIVNYEKISSAGEEVRIDDRKVNYSVVVIDFENVKTDTGTIYKRIRYSQKRIDVTHPDIEGIIVFSVAIPAENEKGFQEVSVGEVVEN